MESILDIFNPLVGQSGDTITVTYCHENYSGTCTYKEMVLKGTKLRQRVHILTGTDMGDVIEYLYKTGKVRGSDDLSPIGYEIQRHSRRQVSLHSSPILGREQLGL